MFPKAISRGMEIIAVAHDEYMPFSKSFERNRCDVFNGVEKRNSNSLVRKNVEIELMMELISNNAKNMENMSENILYMIPYPISS